MDFVNRQLECKLFATRHLFCSPSFPSTAVVEILGFAGFVADHVGERERVAERLEQEPIENPINGPQHF